ncbi:hypothetical protein [Candidatus Oscillochloris fontis]|uniref:hypothetical protein n=1 Tax=Candidatus Oscillochloris fontis TaxID=2496868 RepID=UPI00101C62EF|nr:hypothetical protein [Candidatus Oscillochloris fontis]
MNNTPNSPDVAEVLEALRAEVRAAHANTQKSDHHSGIERELAHCAEEIEIARVVSAHWPLEGRNAYERGWAMINKVVRRYLRWYINPIVEQQNSFNDASARAIRQLIAANSELRAQVAELRSQLAPTKQTEES